jgi:hypothetical protein
MTGGSAGNSGRAVNLRSRGPRGAHGCRSGGAGHHPYRRGRKALIIRVGVGGFFPNGRIQMAHANRLHHEIDLVRRGTQVLVIGSVWAAFAVLAVAATVYDVGKWLAVW